MICDNVLRIKHLPKELSEEEKEEFLTHFGAIQVAFLKFKNDDVIALAKFENGEVARVALFRLHQLLVLNSRLVVVYSERDIGDREIKPKKIEDDNFQKKCFKNFILKMHSFNHSVGFHQPPPPHLRYEYPKPNKYTINNIAHVLINVPKFYTQVLHLMNRMNLPPPFVTETPNPKHDKPPLNVVPPKPIPQPEIGTKSSSESEIESDGETRPKDVIPQRPLVAKKGIKRQKFIKPNVVQGNPSKKLRNEEVFDAVNISVQKKIEVKVPGHIPDKVEGDIESMEKNDEQFSEDNTVSEQKGNTISDEELKSNQIPRDNLSVLAVFKDYHPGVPSNRLYIKNIAKNVTSDDLAYIFNRYKGESTDSASLFEIKLMQEGRMKGQAFVTLDDVKMAQKAIEETNGFILKDKPLVVVYGRSAVKKTKS